MAEIKGKFIGLACSLMSAYPEAQGQANELLKSKVGKGWTELELEGWYDTAIFNEVMELYSKASVSGVGALVTLGRKVYPTIKAGGGIPAQALKSPLDTIKFEAQGFLENHRGDDVVARKLISARDREVIVQAPAPGYSEKLYEGVFLGILELHNVKTGKVVRSDNSTFTITW